MSDWESIRDIYNNYRKQVSILNLPDPSKIDTIYFFGMGGSGIIGKFFENIAYEMFEKKVIAFNAPNVPRYITENDFAIIISYSGNTKETLNVFREIKSKNIRCVCITSNGELASLSRNKILLPKGMLPREAFVQIFCAALSIFDILFNYPFLPSLNRFEELKPAIDNISINFKEEPVIIYSWHSYLPAALRFKQQLNENSKIQAYAMPLPEACHNEIEGVKLGSLIVLRGYKEWKDLVDAFINVLPKKPVEIKIKDKNYIAELLAMAYLADVVSIKIAERRGVNWRETPKIKEYKSLIK